MGQPTKRSAIAAVAGLLGLVVFMGWPAAKVSPPPPPRFARKRPAERATAPRAVEDPAPAAPLAPVAPQGPTVERDERGALTRLVTAGGREWRIDRDAAGRPVRIDGPAGGTALERDGSGRVVARVDATGARTEIRHDLSGRPIAFEAGSAEETLRYDASGRLAEARAGLERLSFTYDDSVDPVAQVRVEDHAAGVAIDYRCESGRQEVRSPFGASTWIQDAAGRLVRLETPAGAFTWEYDDASRAVVRTAPNGVSTRYSWDDAARTERVVAAGPTGEVLRLARAWDGSNHVEAIERDGERARFGHDAAGQLTSIEASDGATRRLVHDADGNRIADGATTFEHDARGRLRRASDGRRFVHDAAGRLQSIVAGAVEDSFAYDAFGRLVSVRRAGGPRVTYGYDGLGRIVTRHVDGAVTRYVHDGSRLLAELGPGGRRRTYVYGPGLDEPLAYRDGDGGWVFLHADTLGHVLAYSDESGARVDSTALDPWGVTTRATSQPRPTFFSGRLVDPVTGLVHLRARFYDPALGRFLTPDPVGLLGGPNAYAYVRNDPLGRIDPLGLTEELPPWVRQLMGRVVGALPEEAGDTVTSAALSLWSVLDADTRERLRETPRWELYAATLERRVSEIARGYEPTAKELLFLKGEVIGLSRGIAAMVEAAPELANFAVDLAATAIALAHDELTPIGRSAAQLGEERVKLAETYELESGLSHVFARGEAGKLITEAFTQAPERIAEASQRTGILLDQHQYQAAGEVFGEVVLMEAANWIMLATSLAKQGISLASLTALERRALVREAMAIGYKPGVGGETVERLAAFVRNRRNRAAPAPAAPVAPVAAHDGLVQVLDPDAPRGRGGQTGNAVAEAPRSVPDLPADTPPPAARTSGETGPTHPAPGDANRARGPPAPERTKTRGEVEDQLSDRGRSHPAPLTGRELETVTQWQRMRNRLLKKWRERSVEMFPEETQRLLRGKADNALRKHMTPDDAAAVLKENRGVEILKPDGTKFDHMDECLAARDSLSNTIEAIEERLSDVIRSGRPAAGEVEALRERLTDLSRALDEYPRPADSRAEIVARRAAREAKARNAREEG